MGYPHDYGNLHDCDYIQGQSILESASFSHESVFDILNRIISAWFHVIHSFS